MGVNGCHKRKRDQCVYQGEWGWRERVIEPWGQPTDRAGQEASRTLASTHFPQVAFRLVSRRRGCESAGPSTPVLEASASVAAAAPLIPGFRRSRVDMVAA